MKRTLYVVVGAIVIAGLGYLIYTISSGTLNSAYKVELFVPDENTDTCSYEYDIALEPSQLSFCGNTNLNKDLRDGFGLEVYNGVLNLARMRFSRFPAQLGEYNCINELILERNCLTSFPTAALKIDQLRELDLSDNNISRIPDIEKNSNIEILKLDDNNISSLNGKAIAKFTKLRHLLLRNNVNISSLPKEVEKMHHIEIIDVRGSKLAKDSPEIRRLMKAMPNTSIYYYSKKKRRK